MEQIQLTPLGLLKVISVSFGNRIGMSSFFSVKKIGTSGFWPNSAEFERRLIKMS